MGRIVIVVYRPKSGCEEKLHQLIGKHNVVLREQRLATEREPIAMRAEDGSFIEVFEWASREAVEQAHNNSAVQAIWAEFAELCEFVPLGKLVESQQPFSEFDAVSLNDA